MLEAIPSKNVHAFFADSESCEHCVDFFTCVGRGSKSNSSVTIFSKSCYANVVINGKPSSRVFSVGVICCHFMK